MNKLREKKSSKQTSRGVHDRTTARKGHFLKAFRSLYEDTAHEFSTLSQEDRRRAMNVFVLFVCVIFLYVVVSAVVFQRQVTDLESRIRLLESQTVQGISVEVPVDEDLAKKVIETGRFFNQISYDADE